MVLALIIRSEVIKYERLSKTGRFRVPLISRLCFSSKIFPIEIYVALVNYRCLLFFTCLFSPVYGVFIVYVLSRLSVQSRHNLKPFEA